MLLYPAIDLMNGQAVRLKQGRANEKTVYSDDPPATAAKWEEAGGDWLHLVDLDAAFTGELKNLEVIRAITDRIEMPCQLGGGMRTLPAIEQALAAGIKRVVIGTKAVENPDFVQAALRSFGAERIAVGIDARNGMVNTRGWTSQSKVEAEGFAVRMGEIGVRTLIYTDIATDGMLSGPNLPALERLASKTDVDLIASGGVSSIDDLVALAELPGVTGAIIGKALYDGQVDLPEAVRRLAPPDKRVK